MKPCRQRLAAAVALAALLTLALPIAGNVPSAGAQTGEAQPQLTDKTASVASATGGDLITYTITFTCSNTGADGCDGAQFADPLPTFADIYGNEVPVEFVDATFPASTFPTGFTVDDSVDPPVVRATAGTWPPGTSGQIQITVRVPPGVVPPGAQTLANQATVTDPDDGDVDPSTTANTTIDAAEPDWTISKLGPSEIRPNHEYTWVIRVCPEVPNAVLPPVIDVTDVLPPGFQYTGSDPAGTFIDDGTPADGISDGAATVTWHFDEATPPPPFDDEGCFVMDVTGQFPSDYEVDGEPVNGEGEVKTNTASGEGTDPGGDTDDFGDDDSTGTMTGPQFGGVGAGKDYTDLAGVDDFYVTSGDEGRFNLSVSVDSDFPLDSVILEDGDWDFDNGADPPTAGYGLPESFLPTSIDPGTWNDPVLATIQGRDLDTDPWTDIAVGVASGDPEITLDTPFRAYRWVWDGDDDVVGAFVATGQQIIGEVGEPSDAFGLYTDTATATVVPVGAPDAQGSGSDQYLLEDPTPDPGITKTVDEGTRQPGQSAAFSVTVDNSPDATDDLVDPVVEDCVPEYLDVTEVTAADPWEEVPGLTCANPGDTPVRYQWAATLEPGEATTPIEVDFEVRGPDTGDPAPFGTYVNTALVVPDGGGSFPHCQQGNPDCDDEAEVIVPATVQLDSAKCVSGQLDGGVFRPTPSCDESEPAVVAAQTVPGGLIVYLLELTNVGNTRAVDAQFVDILPHEGDTAVISGSPLTPRNSEYTPFLLTPIQESPGWTIEYSTSDNPCRPEVGGPDTGCDDPAWTETPDLLALSTYRSVRGTYDGILEVGETGTFSWAMRAPVADGTYDNGGSDPDDPYEFLDVCSPTTPASDPTHCPRAVNSFAYGADAAVEEGTPTAGRLFAEPPQVEVRVTRPPSANAIGDRVWYDRDFDGIQDPDEDGLPDVRVELWDATDTTQISQTFTDGDGLYLFGYVDSEESSLPLPSGDYVVRFYPEPGWYVSPQDVTPPPGDAGAFDNSDDDSDVPQEPEPATDHHVTVPVTVGDQLNNPVGEGAPGETDRTWDLGLWTAEPAIAIEKVTKDDDWADTEFGDDVLVVPGRPITWRYTITNTGNTRLEDVAVTDDGGPDADFDVTTCEVTVPGQTGADPPLLSSFDPVTGLAALNRGAELECTAQGTSATADYDNLGSVVGTPVFDDGSVLDDGPDGTPAPATVDAQDPSSYVPLRYDLALAKTVGTPNLAAGTATFTITVANQGNVASGDYTVSDLLPPGLEVVAMTPEATTQTGDDATGTALTWDLTGLAVDAQQVITIDVEITDFTTRPWRNVAELSADGAGDILTGNEVPTPTSDADSTIDIGGVDFTNDGDYGPVGDPSDVDNGSIDDAGEGADAPPVSAQGGGEDDADIADLDPTITYDLALAKVAVETPIGLGEAPAFTVRVYNQGNVPSGGYTVRDQLPDGLGFDADGSSSGCAAAGDQVVCTGTDLLPGESATFTIATTIDGDPDDLSTAPWQNWAEIDTDSADDLYTAPDRPVADADSVPEGSQSNGIGADDAAPDGEDVIDVTTVGDAYSGPDEGDEDDNDFAIVESSVVYDLALFKTVAVVPPTQTADGTATYTVTVANQGTVDSGTYTVTDVVPAGLDVTDADGGSITENGDGTTTVVWSGTNLEPDEITNFTIEATVVELTDRPYRNVAEISDDSAQELYGLDDVDSDPDDDPTNDGDYGDPGSPSAIDNLDLDDAGVIGGDPQDDADIADFTFPVTYDLALAKVADAEIIEYDDVITYTVTVQNQGVVDAHEFTVTDLVPAGLDVDPDSISHDGTISGSTITWVIDDLAPAASIELTFEATVADITLRPFRNQAEITSDSADDWSVEGDEVTDTDSDPDDDPTNDGDYGDPGSPSVIDNASVEDAGVTGGDPQDDADIADVDVDVVYDLALVKTGPASMEPLGEVTFTITVQNQGNVPSGAYTVTDLVPAGLVATEASDGGTIAPDGSSVTWTDLPSLDPDGTATLTVTMEADPIPDGLTERPFTNVAEITADSAGDYTSANETVADADSEPGDEATSEVDNAAIDEAGTGDDEGYDDEDVAVVTTEIDYDLALAKFVDVPAIGIDGTATYTIVVQNQGNVPSGAYTVTDLVPAGLAVSNISDDGELSLLERRITWTDLPNLDPGATTTLTFDVTITDITLRPYVNVAEITADSADDYSADGDPVVDLDSVPDDEATSTADNFFLFEAGLLGDQGFDDEDIAVLTAPVFYDVALVKTADPADIAFDGTATFTVTVVNQGNVPSHELEVTDVVPAGLLASNVSDGGVLSDDGTTITWIVEDLAPDESIDLTFDVTIADMTTRPWLNVAEVTADSAGDYSTETTDVVDRDSVPGDDETSDADNTSLDEAGEGDDEGFDDEDVAPLASTVLYDLAIDKRLLPDQSYAVGDPVVYEVEVTNEGNVPSGLYTFTDTLPPGMAFVSASDGGTAAGQVVTWTDRPSLDPGGSATVTVTATVTDPSLDEYRNWVQITEDSADDYDAAGEDVQDADSVPDNGEQGEDDDDFEVIPPGDVAADNAGPLPTTGSDTRSLVVLGMGLALLGLAALVLARGRARSRPARH